MDSLSFNRENLIGIAEKSTSANNFDESRVSRLEFENHRDYDPRHVSFKDRHNWNKSLTESKDYTDKKFDSIIGKFKFNLIGIDNRLTLSDIILSIFTKLLNRVNISQAECKIIMEETLTEIQSLISNDVTTRLDNMDNTLLEIDSIKKGLNQEIKDREDTVKNINQLKDELFSSYDEKLEESVDSLNTSIKNVDDKVEVEIINRTAAMTNFENTYTATLDQYEKSIQSMISQYESFINDKLSLISILEGRVSELESGLTKETNERKDMDNQILLKINN